MVIHPAGAPIISFFVFTPDWTLQHLEEVLFIFWPQYTNTLSAVFDWCLCVYKMESFFNLTEIFFYFFIRAENNADFRSAVLFFFVLQKCLICALIKSPVNIWPHTRIYIKINIPKGAGFCIFFSYLSSRHVGDIFFFSLLPFWIFESKRSAKLVIRRGMSMLSLSEKIPPSGRFGREKRAAPLARLCDRIMSIPSSFKNSCVLASKKEDVMALSWWWSSDESIFPCPCVNWCCRDRVGRVSLTRAIERVAAAAAEPFFISFRLSLPSSLHVCACRT